MPVSESPSAAEVRNCSQASEPSVERAGSLAPVGEGAGARRSSRDGRQHAIPSREAVTFHHGAEVFFET
jgi:hypothetical protein